MFAIGVGIWLAVAVAGLLGSRWPPVTARLTGVAIGRLYWLGLAAAAVAGIAQLTVAPVPAPSNGTDEAGVFSVERAQAHVEEIASRPHPMGSPAIESVRSYLLAELRAVGFDPVEQEVSAPDWFGGSNAPISVVNVIARIPGTATTGAVAVVAHYDTVPETPGANDDTSGVAVALEVARLFSTDQLRNDVILLFTDGEEPSPRYGATAFVDEHEWSPGVRFVVNLEAIGPSGPSWLTAAHGPQSWWLDHYIGTVPRPAAYSFLTETTDLIGGSTSDFDVFRDADVPGVEFVYGRGSSIYHTAADTPASVSDRSLFSHGVNTVALVREMAAADLSDIGGHDMVFFTIGRDRVVRYPAGWAIPSACLAGAALIETARRRRRLELMVRSAGDALVRLGLVAVLATLVWMFLAGWRDTMGATESSLHLVLLGLVAVALTIWTPIRRSAGRHRSPEGVLLVCWILALATSVTAPGMSYLFVLPPLLGALVLPFDGDTNDGRPGLGPAVLVVGGWFLLLMPAIDVFHQFAQPRPSNPDSEVLAAVAVPVLLIALAASLAWSMRASRPAVVTRVGLDASRRSGRQFSSA